MNKKRTSESLAAIASKIMKDKNASKIQKSLAAGVLAQRDPSKQTGAEMEKKAAAVLKSDRYSEVTRKLAASLVAQANKER